MRFFVFNPNRRKINGADTLVLSAANSGRTWLRVLLNKYLSIKYGIEFSMKFEKIKPGETIPFVFFSHEIWHHIALDTFFQRLKGKHLIPDKVAFEKKLIILSRDPRDMVVSRYFHVTKNEVDPRHLGTISKFIRDERCGIRPIVTILNNWRMRFAAHPRCLWINYEALRTDTVSEFRRILEFIEGSGRADEAALLEAVRFSDFENMKRMEKKGEIKSEVLKHRNPGDPDSFKVRSGVVKGYLKHFGPEDLSYLDDAVSELDPFYGYGKGLESQGG